MYSLLITPSLRKQKCRLKSTTTNEWRHFGQSEQRKSSILFPIQSEKSPDSGFFTCDPTKKCIMPSSRERHKGIIGRGHDLRLHWLQRFVLWNLVRKKSSDTPRVTFFLNLKEHNQEFLLTGPMVLTIRNIKIPDWREGLKSRLEVLPLTNSLL